MTNIDKQKTRLQALYKQIAALPKETALHQILPMAVGLIWMSDHVLEHTEINRKLVLETLYEEIISTMEKDVKELEAEINEYLSTNKGKS